MARIKVLHIIKSLGRGGAEMLLPETLSVHDREAFEFHYIYFLPWKDQMVAAIREKGAAVTCLPANNNLQLMTKSGAVCAYVAQHGIQVIHAHLPWAGILARWVGKRTGVPVVYTEHNKQERYHFGTRTMNLATMNWLTRVIAVSEDVEQSIRKNKPSLKAPLQTILNGVNTQHFSPGKMKGDSVREALHIPALAPVIGTIAVFRFQKRLDLWLELAAKILKQMPKAHFLILGDGPLRKELEAKRDELGLQQRVHFTGLQTEIRPYVGAMDLYMMTSVFEGLPIALLEAMAQECAVITTDAGGIKEVIRAEKDGLICPVDQPDQLVGFALRLLNDPEKRRNLGREGRKRVEEAFSITRMVHQLETVYRELSIPVN